MNRPITEGALRRGHPLKLKAILFSNDEGKTWQLMRQYYLTDVTTNAFLDEILQGVWFKRLNGDSNGNEEEARTKA